MGKNYFKKSSKDEIRDAFKYFDKDNSGYVTVDEFYQIMKNFRGSHSRKQIEQMVENIDKDQNGKINIDGGYFWA